MNRLDDLLKNIPGKWGRLGDTWYFIHNDNYFAIKTTAKVAPKFNHADQALLDSAQRMFASMDFTACTTTFPETYEKDICRCEACAGSGEIYKWKKCDKCNGTGAITCKACGNDALCLDCNGNGREKIGASNCGVCSGKGTVLGLAVVANIRIKLKIAELINSLPGSKKYHILEDHTLIFTAGDEIQGAVATHQKMKKE